MGMGMEKAIRAGLANTGKRAWAISIIVSDY
jgi:hypothetical protein